MQFLNLLKPHFEWKQNSFTGPICHRDLRETDPVPLNHYNQPLITKKSIARWHAWLKNSWQLFSRAGKHEWPMWSWCYLNFGCRGGAANHLIGAAKYLFASIQNDNSTLLWENLHQYHNSIQITQGTSQEGWVNILWSGNDPRIWEKVGNVLISQATPPNHECLKLTTFNHLFWEN